MRLLVLLVIISLSLKYIEKKKGRRRIGRKRRIPQSELSMVRRKFHKLSGDGYFDPIKERDQLTKAFKQLSEARTNRKETEEYKRSLEALKKIMEIREKDAGRIRELGKWKKRYNDLGDTFSDNLRSSIESCLKRSDEILSAEHFAMYMPELKRIARHLPWLVSKGEEGRDNSVHWPLESRNKMEELDDELKAERQLWDVLGIQMA